MRQRFSFYCLLWLLIPGLSAAQQSDIADDLTDTALYERADHWQCKMLVRYSCGDLGCLRSPEEKIEITLDFNRSLFNRCDNQGCQKFRFEIEPAGVYTMIDYHPTTLFKVLNDGSVFVEVTTYNTATFTGYGKCQVKE